MERQVLEHDRGRRSERRTEGLPGDDFEEVAARERRLGSADELRVLPRLVVAAWRGALGGGPVGASNRFGWDVTRRAPLVLEYEVVPFGIAPRTVYDGERCGQIQREVSLLAAIRVWQCFNLADQVVAEGAIEPEVGMRWQLRQEAPQHGEA